MDGKTEDTRPVWWAEVVVCELEVDFGWIKTGEAGVNMLFLVGCVGESSHKVCRFDARTRLLVATSPLGFAEDYVIN